MVPFRKTKEQARNVAAVERKQNLLVAKYTAEMSRTLNAAALEAADSILNGGKLVLPDLSKLDEVSEAFYRQLLTEAFMTNKRHEFSQVGKKKLTRLPLGLPKTFRELERIFRDRRFWPSIVKRSKVLNERLMKQFNEKIRKQFAVISPLLQTGEITPRQVKEAMLAKGKASRALVETRFRTETTTYFSQAQVKFYEGDEQIIGYLFDSVADNSRTPICRSRHGLVYRPNTVLLAENTPSLHWNCRSHLIPLANTERNRTMLADPSRDPAKRNVVPLPTGWNLQGTGARSA